MSDSANICIHFSDTGGGHRSAAEAVTEGIKSCIDKRPTVAARVHIMTQPLIEASHPINKGIVSFYNYLARHHTTWIKYFYKMIGSVRLESGYHYKIYRSFMHELLLQQKPSLIVAVHPMVVEALSRARDEVLDPSVKVAVVITDPNERLWRAWACNRADLFIAPNDVVLNKLVEWGVDAKKIKVLGMPVHPAFLSEPHISRAKFLSTLGLSPDLFTICINAGWAGNAHLLKAYAALANCKRRIQVVFLSGYNRDLYEAATAKAEQTGITTKVLQFYNQMPELMSAVDVMVTKAGGLTTYQALARRLPLIFDNTIEPMPQEEPTISMLVRCALARRLDDPRELSQMIDNMVCNRQAKSSLPSRYQLNLTDHAIYDIAETLLDIVFPSIYRTSVEEVA